MCGKREEKANILCLITEEPLGRARVVYLDGPCWDLGGVCGYGHEARIGSCEVECSVQLSSAGLVKEKVSTAIVCDGELTSAKEDCVTLWFFPMNSNWIWSPTWAVTWLGLKTVWRDCLAVS